MLEEVPTTPVGLLNHTAKYLETEASHKLSDLGRCNISAHSWDGAGSERGGSVGGVQIKKLLFLPSENDHSLVVAYADGAGGWGSHPYVYFGTEDPVLYAYSVVLLERAPNTLCEKIINCVEKTGSDSLTSNALLEDFLQTAVDQFCGGFLFATDSDTRPRPGFYVKPNMHCGYPPESDILVPVNHPNWQAKFQGTDESREQISKHIASLLRQGDFGAQVEAPGYQWLSRSRGRDGTYKLLVDPAKFQRTYGRDDSEAAQTTMRTLQDFMQKTDFEELPIPPTRFRMPVVEVDGLYGHKIARTLAQNS